MSVPQYLRQISLKVGDATDALDLSDMRIRFAVRRGDIATPNTADIRVYNLSDDTVKKIQKEFERVVLQAGYPGNYGTIFDGTIKQVRRGRESQTDTYIDITAADGDSAYNFGVMNVTLAGGSTAQDHLDQVLKSLASRGITMGESPELSPSKLPRGKVFYGMTRDFLDILGKTQDVSWSIQDRKLTLIPNNAYLPGDAVVVTSATGMIGLPEQNQNGINVRTLLNPGIRVGKRLKLDNTSIQKLRLNPAPLGQASVDLSLIQIRTDSDGFYKVLVANHYGDNRGNDWYTDTICISIDAAVTNGSMIKAGTGIPGAIATPGPVKPFG
ncbi:hypothetical protein POF45_26930 [Pseudomonas sp. 681]|uniref:Bacteriophage protein n=1 Tax=Pseudomonas fungipugnans TaxID=3024217 RepID=A0ABT6QVW2_9PSED|nr:hypothetical protein [Pseudomonas sp. 681]MDI2595029.1 hypothetical protein [Pseudomonas sp. 681]